MTKQGWFLVAFLGGVCPASAQIGFEPYPCVSESLPTCGPGTIAMPPIDVPFCVQDVYGNDIYINCPSQAAHYLVVPPACDPWTRSNKFPVMVLFRGQGDSSTNQSTVTCCTVPPSEHWTPYAGHNSSGDLMNEASRRGWYAVSLLGVPGNQYWYGSPQGLYGAEQALKDFLAGCPDADKDRIVGVGFSMGGDNVLSYGARHLDPQSPYGMFAAMVVLSGNTSTSHRWVFWDSQNDIQNGLQQMLCLPTCNSPNAQQCSNCMGSPIIRPYAYQQSSGVFTGCDTVLDPGEELVSLARNLLHIQILGLVATGIPGDPPDVRQQMSLLNDTMNALDPTNWTYISYSVAPHSWNIYHSYGTDAFFTLLGGARLSLRLPPQAHVLVADNPDPSEAVDNRWYFYFKPTRILNDVLGQFHWAIEAGTQNRLTLQDVSNLSALRTRTGTGVYASGLVTTNTLKVKFVHPLAQDLDVVLEGYTSPPQLVTRVTHIPGMPNLIEFMSSPQDWEHDGSATPPTLTLKQGAELTYDKTWIVTP